MKLRISGNSLRLRLSRLDVERFASTGSVEDAVEFGTGRLAYSMRQSDSPLRAIFDGSAIQVDVPRDQAREWTSTDLVGIEGSQPLDGGKTLDLLIEKDFKCIHKTGPENAASYPNPLEREHD